MNKYLLSISSILLLVTTNYVNAEPYLATKTGLKCMACHVNPTGGGKRTAYGSLYGQTSLLTKSAESEKVLIPQIGEFLSLGSDVRVNANYTDIPDADSQLDFNVESAKLYFEFNLIPDRLTLYFDESVAPGGAINREAYGLYWFDNKSKYIKAGKMFLPYGLRLEDDSAFIRQVSGINFTTPDTGVEAGLELDEWSLNFAVTNGTAGSAETNKAKQYSFRAEYIQQKWRAGVSYNLNGGDQGDDREMANLFMGLKMFNIAWLAEYDVIQDNSISDDQLNQSVSLIEANIEAAKGHNVKITYEYFDPDDDIKENERERLSALWEFVPMRFTQIRMGYRDKSGIPQDNLQNTKELFVQSHLYF